MSVDATVEVLRSETGHFDPEILDAFVGRFELAEKLVAGYRREPPRPAAA